jgi:drug/metabolite transporter (DMT)-like permease
MKRLHLALLIVMNLFWAGTYSAFKALTQTLTPGEVTTLRFFIASVLIGILWPWLPGLAPRRGDLLKTAIMGILVFSIGPRVQILGVQLGKAGDASVLIALEPLVTAVAAALFLREPVPLRRWAGFAIGMTGVVLLSHGWRFEFPRASLLANLIFVSSFVCEAAYSVIGKPILERSGILKTVAVALGWGTLANLWIDGPNTWARLPGISWDAWLILAYLAVICTLVGYSIWYVVIREADVSLAAMTILIQPALGVLIAAVSVGEPLHWGQLWGSAAIVAGLVVGLNLQRPNLAPAKTSLETTRPDVPPTL